MWLIICETTSGGTPLKSREDFYYPQEIPWINSGEIRNGEIYQANKYISRIGLEKSSAKIVPANSVLVAMYGATAGQVGLLKIEASTNQAICSILPNERFNPKFLYYVLSSKTNDLIEMSVGGAQPNISQGIIKNIEIPLPPLDFQEEIVKELDGYQAVIDGAQKVIDNWKPTLPINPNWKTYNIEEIAEFISGVTIAIKDNTTSDGVPILSIANVSEDGKIIGDFDRVNIGNKNVNYAQKDDLLFNWRNGSKHLVGKTAYYDLEEQSIFGSFLLGIRPNKALVNPRFLWVLLNKYRKDGVYLNYMRESINGLFNREELKTLDIPLPPIEEQNEIILNIDVEEKAIEECKKLIKLHQYKINTKIQSIWGEGEDCE